MKRLTGLILTIVLSGCGGAKEIPKAQPNAAITGLEGTVAAFKNQLRAGSGQSDIEELEQGALRYYKAVEGKPEQADAQAIFDSIAAVSTAMNGRSRPKLEEAVAKLDAAVAAVKAKYP